MRRLAVTKVDILDTFEQIKVGIGYELDGRPLEHPPGFSFDWVNICVLSYALKFSQLRRLASNQSQIRDLSRFLAQ